MLLAAIPSPSVNGFYVGPLFIHFYALMYIVGISIAVALGRRRWRARGGDPELVDEMALWGVPFGILGGRLYFDLTTPKDIPPHWWGPLAVWDGGLGIWGGVALATGVCVWRLRRAKASVTAMMDTLAPCLLIAQAVGRIGNYFNQELFGGPTSLPWGLEIDPAFRPPGYAQDATFHPTFLYELVWDLALAGFLIWLGRRGKVRQGSLFALYVAGYSAFRIFEESLRVDYSQYFLGLRLNFYIATLGTLAGLAWFAWLNRRRPEGAEPADEPAAQPQRPEQSQQPEQPEQPEPEEPGTPEEH
ncbi:prolipoprotein diacylglyceryl transferase [Kitasatospora sp. NBC_01287]|uniref:prolipoprotein diacylglyceryl transferase n=1 Tax=Kitasatospora sp. NBC_01287 TaxID=2903573 RepID=UPI002259D5CD|nr:prolipoprotein diacylglyceryl transferase [Kitasatospora sp. NBC_01287]MCX4746107.1 prolipoprotein diacylglyceryl transferase [Kitasatospora sp. NBC_01287]